jgi:hypothetical protein
VRNPVRQRAETENAQDIAAVPSALMAVRPEFVAGWLIVERADAAGELLAGKEAP